MPLSVEVKINGDPLNVVHIGRMEPLLGDEEIHLYKTLEGAVPEWEWKDGVTFLHRYSDGALVCVRKALEALGH